MINSLMGLLISKGILGLGAYDVEECHLDEVEMYAWPDISDLDGAVVGVEEKEICAMYIW